MKGLLKKFFVFFLISIFLMSNVVFAEKPSSPTQPIIVDEKGNVIDPSEIISKSKEKHEAATSNVSGSNATGTNTSAGNAASEIREKGETILSAVLWAGYTISLGMVVFIGIKYITGAAEAKSNMKTAIVNWMIGAFLVFMCTSVAAWVMNAAGVSDGDNLASEILNAAN